MNAELIGQVLAALFSGYIGKAIFDYIRDRHKARSQVALLPYQAESQRIANVAEQLLILERMNDRLERRIVQLENELSVKETQLDNLQKQINTLRQEAAELRWRLEGPPSGNVVA